MSSNSNSNSNSSDRQFIMDRKKLRRLGILRNLKVEYGPLFTLNIGSCSAIFVASHSLAYQALVQQGAVFSDRPRVVPIGAVVNSNQRITNSASYGPVWRLLRRNLMSEILHPSHVKS
ncbi:hypothetical protein T459_09775 [Capsicum annuum]|uniref:Cytochrome P450 89A2-like n=1 Tax=Capsicum annuum TaxID=4072 RepID=A0A2G3A0B3_CAPAN|nr:hypothetical protein T459_09775 [Capsicum annuum]